MYKYVTECISHTCNEYRYLWIDLITDDYYISGTSPEIVIYGESNNKQYEKGYIKSLDNLIKNAIVDILLWPYKVSSYDLTNKFVQYQGTYWYFTVDNTHLYSILQMRQNFCNHDYIFSPNGNEICNKCYKDK